MSKKEYVEKYIQCLDNALKGLFDEAEQERILKADQEALGEDYKEFEATITAAYDKVEEARDLLRDFVAKKL